MAHQIFKGKKQIK